MYRDSFRLPFLSLEHCRIFDIAPAVWLIRWVKHECQEIRRRSFSNQTLVIHFRKSISGPKQFFSPRKD
uniref:Uncharacterized protein n=1 Tax=Anguilla anguilla TaxID=7936 RepID=A0A0E9WWP0_ANGAN